MLSLPIAFSSAIGANRATTSFTLVGHSADFTLSVLIRRV